MGDQRIALVTGANKGIGFEVARALGAAGVTVLVGARQVALGEAAAATLQGEGHDARFIRLDVTQPDHAPAVAERIEADFGRLDILVNNAAMGLDFTPPSEVTDEDFRAILETNLLGPVRLIRTLLPLLRRSAAGRIVNVSSDFGSLTLNADPTKPHATTACLAYPASKAALNQVTVQFAKELRGSTVAINSVNPGFTDTDMISTVGLRSPRTAAQGAQAVVDFALAPEGGPSGGFFDDQGTVPW